MRDNPSPHWAQVEEAGVYWLMRFTFFWYSLAGRKLFLVILYPVVSYYFLTNKRARDASLDFLKHIEDFTSGAVLRSTWWQSYKHFLTFGESMVDKLSAWTNRITLDDVVIHGREEIAARLTQNLGGMIIGSHLGNIEVCRALVTISEKARINILVHTKHAENFNRLLREVSVANHIELLQVTEINPAMAISLDRKVKAGEFVFIVGDRVPVDNNARIQDSMFLGETARFSQGPYILASLLKCPVYTLFCLKKDGVFNLFFEHFSDGVNLPRTNRQAALQNHVDQFAQRLQTYCLMAPLQWFNFYHYWQRPAGN